MFSRYTKMSEKTKMIHAEKFINGKQHGHKKIS
jgi:hypothetical protein